MRNRVKEWVLNEFNLDLKYEIYKKFTVDKQCPVCKNTFSVKASSKNNVTCSRGCANTYFMTGSDHPNWKGDYNYRRICFSNHEKKCIICGEDKIVEVHHFDGNHDNDEPSNLVPLCPTHHKYWHSRYKNLIEGEVTNYVKNWIKVK